MTYPSSFADKVLSVARALEGCGVPYAMGGAISYVYHAEPRTTIDIDVNVFVSELDATGVLRCLESIGINPSEQELDQLRRASQARLRLEGTFVDLFFPVHAFHESCASRTRRVRFDGGSIQILSAEDLVVFKVIFNRAKDWLDVEQVLRTQGEHFDRAYALRWLDDMVGTEDSARVRFAELIETIAAELT